MICVFSGTGNSLYLADLLARSLGDRLVVYPSVAEAATGERVVWLFPVYSWGVPPIVIKWLDQFAPALEKSGDHYTVMTCGDDAGHAGRQWHRLLLKAGLKPKAETTMFMPNVYVMMPGFDVDSPEVEQEKIKAATEAVDSLARSIADGTMQGDTTFKGRFAGIKSSLIYPWFVRHAMSPKPFHATDACVGCGTCARLCPLHNITMRDGRPVWGDHCALCVRCYHTCPHGAVAYGKTTRGKGRYTAMLPVIARMGMPGVRQTED